MSTQAQELHRIISASVRDMLDAYRIQAQTGPLTDQALEQILFRAAHGVVQSLAPHWLVGRGAQSERAQNPKVVGSNPTPATRNS
jgi:hypothetical protein